jgi:hypothetical protein
MLKLLTRLIDWITDPTDIDLVELDPLQHPALERMSERELADLPFRTEPHATRCIA